MLETNFTRKSKDDAMSENFTMYCSGALDTDAAVNLEWNPVQARCILSPGRRIMCPWIGQESLIPEMKRFFR